MPFLLLLGIFATSAFGNELVLRVGAAPGAAFDETKYFLEAALVHGDALAEYLALRQELRAVEGTARGVSDALQVGALLRGWGFPGQGGYEARYQSAEREADRLRRRRRSEGEGRWLEGSMNIATWVTPNPRAVVFTADALERLSWDATALQNARVVVDLWVWRFHYGTSYVETMEFPVPTPGSPGATPFTIGNAMLRVHGSIEWDGSCPGNLAGKIVPAAQ